jgi:alpha-amylase
MFSKISLLILSLTFSITLQKTKEEWKTRTIYQIITDRFARTSGDTSDCDLHNYCGGTFIGIQNNLDYIAGMGFDAIWISPIVENLDGGYHGYWMKNLYNLNPKFGSEQDFINLVTACHQKGIWVMVDVVANHMAPVGTYYGQLNPFNQPDHYHDYCTINQDDFSNNQWRVEVKWNLKLELQIS